MDKNIEYYLLLHGHCINDLSFKLDASLAQYIEYILDIDRSFKNNKEYKIDKKTLLKRSDNYLHHYFNIHDIGYLNDKIIDNNINNKNILSIDEALDLYNNSCIKMSPFELPIIFRKENKMYGSLIILSPEIDNKYLLNNINIYFEGITLNNHITNHLIPIYIHEIIHTQLESNKGIINNILNKEVLSIFMELLYVYQNNIHDYKWFLNVRLNDIIKDFNIVCKYVFNKKEINANYMMTLSYLISSIKSIKLLDIYINSNIHIKMEIINSIQNVFDANISLEDFLSKYEINYDNSLDSKILKRIIK